MIKFRDMRTLVQAPRKTADSWYGKWVMRRISIYITWLFSHAGLGPNQVTLLSLVAAVWGITSLGLGHLAFGIMGLNLWYLLDHVDGEIARLRKQSSLSGTFFDTVINFLIQPFTLIAWAIGLAPQSGSGILFFGLVAAAGSLMLIVIPMTEEAILFNHSIKTKMLLETAKGQDVAGSKKEKSLFRNLYTWMHTLSTYPCILFLMTAVYLCLFILNDLTHYRVFSYWFLLVYAFVTTGLWGSQVLYKVHFRTLDHQWK